MARDVTVTGVDDFLRVSKALKQSDPDMRREFNKELKRGAKPLIGKTREAFRSGLPQRNGLAVLMARKPLRTKVATGTDPGISIVGKGSGKGAIDPRIDQGRLAHPVFNRRKADGRRVFVVQEVTPGLFSETLTNEAPAVRGDLERTIERYLGTIGG